MANELDPKQVRAWSEEVKASKKELSEIRDLSSVLNNYAKDLTKHQITQNKNMSTYLDASIKAAKSGKITLNQLKSRADIMKEIADGSMDLNQVADKQKNIEKEIVQIHLLPIIHMTLSIIELINIEYWKDSRKLRFHITDSLISKAAKKKLLIWKLLSRL